MQFDIQKLSAEIQEAEKAAAGRCGLSDVPYEKLIQAAYGTILAQAPEALRAETEAVLQSRGFDPDFTPYQSTPGECGLTGIEVRRCPCGAHP